MKQCVASNASPNACCPAPEVPGRSHWEPAPPHDANAVRISDCDRRECARHSVQGLVFAAHDQNQGQCPMCAQAASLFRVRGVEHGARLGCRVVPSSVGVLGGVRASEAGVLLRTLFRERRDAGAQHSDQRPSEDNTGRRKSRPLRHPRESDAKSGIQRRVPLSRG